MSDLISRQAAIDAVGVNTWAGCRLKKLPSAQPYTDEEIQKMQEIEQAQIQKAFALGREDAQPDDRLRRIEDLVEGTIDHFDLEDAMDLLYQVKDVLRV